jgi:flagellar motor switch protein FliG
MITVLLVVLGALSSGVVLAAKGGSASMNPDALGAKAFLEGLLVRRYSLELATLVDRDAFTLGAQLELTPVAPLAPPLREVKPPDFDPYTDLMLGTIDADQLLKSVVAPVDERTVAQKFMENFRIRSVVMSVGLSEDLNSNVKSEVAQWLKRRLSAEFGGAAKSTVTIIKKVPDKKVLEKVPKDWMEWAIQYQNLAGQILLAITILAGVFLWQLLAKLLGTSGAVASDPDTGANGETSEDASDFASLAEAAKELQAEQDEEDQHARDQDEKDRFRTRRDIESLGERLREIMPKMAGSLEEVIRQWCNMGDPGRLRLVCFAEVVFRDSGKLPIPVDALPEVQKVFARMPEIDIVEKREALEKAYWDLLSTLNLGSDSLKQPFSYVENVGLTTIRKVLMDQNPRLRTLVSLYMTKDMRNRYVKSMSQEGKKELLVQAGLLTEIQSEELESMDRGLMGRIKPTVGHEIVSLGMAFSKIVETLTITEEITLLADLQTPGVEEFKRTRPSLAFLGQWPDDHLKILMMGLTPDELVSFLRVRTDLKDRMLGLASMMVAEIAREELQTPDKQPAAETEKAIEFFSQRLQGMVEQNEIILTDVFGPIAGDSGVHHLEMSDNDGTSGGKQVA